MLVARNSLLAARPPSPRRGYSAKKLSQSAHCIASSCASNALFSTAVAYSTATSAILASVRITSIKKSHEEHPSLKRRENIFDIFLGKLRDNFADALMGYDLQFL